MHGLNYCQLRRRKRNRAALEIENPGDSNVRDVRAEVDRATPAAGSPETPSSDVAIDLNAEQKSAKPDFFGMRNLMPITSPSRRYGHRLCAIGQDRVMERLYHRMKRGPRQVDPENPGEWSFWPDKFNGGLSREDNPFIPAGYTYLLQLVAHDIVASSLSLAISDGELAVENARLQPMLLDTIYGNGPDVVPLAYEYSASCRASAGRIPRTRLRIGQTRGDANGGCPFNDIGRARGVGLGDTGLDKCSKTLTEALIADPRNDDHALISQLTLLFHRLHNEIIQFVDTARPVSSSGNNAYANFLCARAVVTVIYRHIILYDVLKRLLNPQVYTHYISQQTPPVTPQGDGVPLEFAAGAFRCGHAMVRERYQVNSQIPLDLNRGLDQSSLRNPGNVPVTPAWIVEWKRFFELDETRPNYSRRLGPNYAGVAHNQWVFPALEDSNSHGLPIRDLLSATDAGLWSVPALIEEFRKDPGLAEILPPYEKLEKPLEGWLKEEPSFPGLVLLQPDDIKEIVADPPMPFFILFEAACTSSDDLADPFDHFNSFRNGGRHLGPLGSIIVAESIVGMMRETDIVRGNGRGIFDPLREQIDFVTSKFGLANGMFSKFDAVDSMPALLKIMLEQNIIQQ